MHTQKLTILLLLASVLSACGGGSSSSKQPLETDSISSETPDNTVNAGDESGDENGSDDLADENSDEQNEVPLNQNILIDSDANWQEEINSEYVNSAEDDNPSVTTNTIDSDSNWSDETYEELVQDNITSDNSNITRDDLPPDSDANWNPNGV